LFVSEYADRVDRLTDTDSSCTEAERLADAQALYRLANGSSWEGYTGDPEYAIEAIHNALRAGAGADWMDIAPETTPSAEAMAEDLIHRLEIANNGARIGFLFRTACNRPASASESKADPDNDDDRRTFGHFLAMESLGHGVAWSDDYPSHGLTVPHSDGSEAVPV